MCREVAVLGTTLISAGGREGFSASVVLDASVASGDCPAKKTTHVKRIMGIMYECSDLNNKYHFFTSHGQIIKPC